MRRFALRPIRFNTAMRRALPALCLVGAMASAWALDARAPARPGLPAPIPASAGATVSEEGPRWRDLSVAQKAALQPLERHWTTLDAARKRKWLDVATRLPRMPADRRDRVQARMVEWAAMSPVQRAQARQQFKEAEQSPPQDRRAQWNAYQALNPDQKRLLVTRAEHAALGASAPSVGERLNAADRAASRDASQQKSNIVPNPALAARPRTVAPVVVQAAPGATTTLMSKKASPPAHQQAGLPKIAATSNFIDPSTLLPQRGPQGAAVTATSASAPLPRP